jgi:hypothetical protein
MIGVFVGKRDRLDYANLLSQQLEPQVGGRVDQQDSAGQS